MSLKKKTYVRQRKEVTVTFIDDNDVHIIENDRGDKCENVQNKKKLVSDSDPPTSSSKRTRNVVNNKETNRIKNNDGSDNDEKPGCDNVDKPKSLFQDGDVPGSAVFGFLTPKRKNAMSEKAALSAEKRTPLSPISSCASPKTPTSNRKKSLCFTPRARRSITLNLIDEKSKHVSSGVDKNQPQSNKKDDSEFQCTNAKTPYSLRARLKSKIAAQVQRNLKDVDSEDSGEDFVPSDLEDDDNSDGSDSDSAVSSSVKSKRLSCNIVNIDTFKLSSNTAVQKRKQKDLTYAISADEYFNSNSGKRNKTSNHTLNKLKNPLLEKDQLNSLLRDANLKTTHQLALHDLRKENSSQLLFQKWLFCLKEGFNILLYGLGSKRRILNTFHQKVLSNSYALVINGFFPGLTMKEIIDSLAGELLGIKDIPTQPHEVVEVIEDKLTSRRSPPVFLIIHNLDGLMLRCEKVQGIIARLSSIPKFYLLASIDHINAPLLWDDKKLSEYNFIWEDVTSFEIYSEETSFENSLLVQKSGKLALASLKNVFQSLTRNGKEIFKILLNNCLDNKSNRKYAGIGFSDLYWKCRDNFLVSTDLALRSQLTEFLDHQLVKWRKDSDHLIVPVDTDVLEQFKTLIGDGDE